MMHCNLSGLGDLISNLCINDMIVDGVWLYMISKQDYILMPPFYQTGVPYKGSKESSWSSANKIMPVELKQVMRK